LDLLCLLLLGTVLITALAIRALPYFLIEIVYPEKGLAAPAHTFVHFLEFFEESI
jgi:hypothetical protein